MVNLVPIVMSDPRASPKPILNIPNTEIIGSVILFDLEKAKGTDIITVITLIEIMVPIENKTRKIIPVVKLGVAGSITNIRAALPAKPWISPMMYDFTRKKGINSGKNPCFL